MASPAMSVYNALLAGKSLEIDFSFKRDAEDFLNLIRVTHHRQAKLLRATGIMDISDPDQSVEGLIKPADNGGFIIKLSLVEKKRRKYSSLSFRILDDPPGGITND